MTGTTISSYTTANLVLTQASQDPVTITAAGTINTAAPNAIYGSFGTVWSIANYGTVHGEYRGIYLASGGTVTNGSGNVTSASISGALYGVLIRGAAGSVTNDGTISGRYGVYCVPTAA